MRTYEALYIVRPDKSDDEIQTIANEVAEMVTTNGGSIVRSEIWGKRKLAYEVKHFSEGVYILIRFQAEPTFIKRLEQHFRLSESIIRYLTTYFDEQTLRLEEEQAVRVKEEIERSASSPRRDYDERVGSRRSRDRDDDDDDD